MSEYRAAKKRITVSVGESVRIIRELQELSQNQLSQITGIPQTTISAIEQEFILGSLGLFCVPYSTTDSFISCTASAAFSNCQINWSSS